MESLSIILPIYNEEKSLPELGQKLCEACDRLGRTCEFILVDDGSEDRSYDEAVRLAQRDPRFRVIRFRRNFGQTAALSAGIRAAKNELIVMMDADLQNDPQDIAHLIEKMKEGYDVVSGWRKDRQDPFLTRTLPSTIANSIISWWTGVHLRDYGCTLKVYRREVLQDVRLYGEMHRFLPFYAAMSGARIAEIPVRHHARQYGVSKYGLSRTFKVLLDLVTIRFLGTYAQKPIYLFGGLGVGMVGLSFVVALYTLYERIFLGIYVHRNPLFLIAAVMALAGLQVLLIGLLAEILMRTYYESQGKTTFLIKETYNLP